jgi:glycosyltransferase involved in cell wall biosynthesis
MTAADPQPRSRPGARRSLRIAMFATFYPPFSFGGDAVGVERLARALVRRGHHVTVIHEADAFTVLGGRPPAAPPSRAADDPEIVTLSSRWPLGSTLLTQQTGRPVVQRRRIAEILAAGRFDILWYNNISLAGGPGLLTMGEGLRVYEAHEHWLVCPMHVLWRHNRELCTGRQCLRCSLAWRRPPQPWRWTGLLDRQARAVDLFIAKSEFSRAKHREMGFAPEMTVVPYFLPDLPAASVPAPAPAPAGPAPAGEPAAAAPGAPHPRPYLLFVGRLERIKGLQDAIPLFAGPDGPDLLVAGDGDYAGELRRLAAGLPRVRFLGRQPFAALEGLYRGARALIVPSVCYETFGIILIESFRFGTPVIARRLGPFPEIVEAAGGGLLFGTADELAAALAAHAADPDLRARQGAAAEAAFRARWSETPVMAAYGAALAAAAGRAGRAGLARALAAGSFEAGPAMA